MSKANDRVRAAFARGVRVDDVGRPRSARGKLLAERWRADGRKVITVRGPDGPGPILVHRLAAYQKFGEAALAPGTHVRHLDNDNQNNELDNLELGDAKTNRADADPEWEAWRAQRAGDATRALDERRERELVELYKRGNLTVSDVADHFGVSRSTVYRIVRRRHAD